MLVSGGTNSPWPGIGLWSLACLGYVGTGQAARANLVAGDTAATGFPTCSGIPRGWLPRWVRHQRPGPVLAPVPSPGEGQLSGGLPPHPLRRGHARPALGPPSKGSPGRTCRGEEKETSWCRTRNFFCWILAGGVYTMTQGPGPSGHPPASLEVCAFDGQGHPAHQQVTGKHCVPPFTDICDIAPRLIPQSQPVRGFGRGRLFLLPVLFLSLLFQNPTYDLLLSELLLLLEGAVGKRHVGPEEARCELPLGAQAAWARSGPHEPLPQQRGSSTPGRRAARSWPCHRPPGC